MTPSVTLHQGDNRETLRRLIDDGVRVHSVVTDPPYGLVSITKRFGKDGSAAAKSNGATGVFGRASAGFMGSKWDGTGIERDPEFWQLIHDILLPGGYVLAFSAARTGHWQACAMEMAGFVMHPFLGWVYGQGFPKAHNAARAVDKALGVDGGFGEPKSAAHAGWIERGAMRGDAGNDGWQRPWMEDADAVSNAARKYLPGSEDAAQWEGWAYGAQSMKPALEPIYVGQKPFSEKNGALNLLKHGVGAMNIDGCRVPTEETITIGRRGHSGDNGIFGADDRKYERQHNSGRHPANLIHDGSDDVVAMFPTANSARASGNPNNPKRGENHDATSYGQGDGTATNDYRDSGSAARFFNNFALDSDPLFYCPKAGKADRAGSKHPTVKPIALMQWLCRLVTPAGGTVLDPFAGSGTTGQAALNEGFNSILMEAEDQFASDIRARFGLAHPDPFDNLFA